MEIKSQKDKTIYLLFYNHITKETSNKLSGFHNRYNTLDQKSVIENFCRSTNITGEVVKISNSIPKSLFSEMFTMGVIYYSWWKDEISELDKETGYFLNKYIKKSRKYYNDTISDSYTRLKVYMIQEVIHRYPTVNKQKMFPKWSRLKR